MDLERKSNMKAGTERKVTKRYASLPQDLNIKPPSRPDMELTPYHSPNKLDEIQSMVQDLNQHVLYQNRII